MTKYDVSSICNALMDILVEADDDDIKSLELNKGIMHLVDETRQNQVKNHFAQKQSTLELGGSSLNAIRTLAALGAKTSFAGMIGKDGFGKHIENRMSELGIDAQLQHSDTSETGTCFILVTPDGERTMNTNLGASCLFDETLVPEDVIADSKIFHFCGYQWGSPEQKKAIKKAVDIAKQRGVTISFDVADPFVVEHNRNDFIDIIKDADIVFANRDEAKLLYQSDPETACDEITKTGAIAVIKLGADGALIGRNQERIAVKPVATSVVDTTAAGDMFASGFLYGYYNDKSLEDCGRIAATLASDVISRIGGIVSKKAIDSVR